MRTSSLQFKNAIKKNVRELDVRFIFYNENKKYAIKGKDIQSFKYNASCEKELGGIEKKIVTLTLMGNTVTNRIDKGTVIYKETWAKFNGSWYSDFQEELTVISKKVDDAKSLIKVEAVDNLSIIRENPMPHIPQQMNVDLKSYFSLVLSKLCSTYTLDNVLTNPSLSLAFIKSNNTHETLLELAIASQGLIKTDFTVKKFTKGTILDKLDYGTGLLDYKIEDDDMNSYKDVVVSLFSPTSKIYKSLGSIMTTIPPSARQYKLGAIEFDKLYIPQLIAFDHQVEIDDYTISSSSCALTITSRNDAILDLTTQFYGLDVNSVKHVGDNRENKTKFINNVYIQSPTAYDTRIYTTKTVTAKYTGNTLYEIGDTIRVDNKHDVLILEHDLTYDGALRGVLKGVVIDG